jgi:hypothetical protein
MTRTIQSHVAQFSPLLFALAEFNKKMVLCQRWVIRLLFDTIKLNYQWVGLYEDVKTYVQECRFCKLRKLIVGELRFQYKNIID